MVLHRELYLMICGDLNGKELNKEKDILGHLWLFKCGGLRNLFPGVSVCKESVCNAGDLGVVGSITDWGDPLKEGMATHSSILAWRNPWTQEPGGLQSIGLQGWTHLKCLSMHTC